MDSNTTTLLLLVLLLLFFLLLLLLLLLVIPTSGWCLASLALLLGPLCFHFTLFLSLFLFLVLFLFLFRFLLLCFSPLPLPLPLPLPSSLPLFPLFLLALLLDNFHCTYFYYYYLRVGRIVQNRIQFGKRRFVALLPVATHHYLQRTVQQHFTARTPKRATTKPMFDPFYSQGVTLWVNKFIDYLANNFKRGIMAKQSNFKFPFFTIASVLTS